MGGKTSFSILQRSTTLLRTSAAKSLQPTQSGQEQSSESIPLIERGAKIDSEVPRLSRTQTSATCPKPKMSK